MQSGRANAAILISGLAFGWFAAAPAAVQADGPSPLNWRLEELASPELRSASTDVQADALSLLPAGPGSLLRDGGRVVVEIRASADTKDDATELAAGAEVLGVHRAYDTVTAAVDERDLRAVAAVPGVESVVEVVAPMSGAIGGTGDDGQAINTCATGVLSEGDAQLRALEARTRFDVDGTGVEVGVLSDSYDTLATGDDASDDVAAAELPGPGNPCGRTTPVDVVEDAGSPRPDEGRAMLQIVHDLAPGAALSFATALTTQAAFADNIRDLATAGADVIVDDIGYFREPMYQDGPIAKAVNDVTAQGVAYFTMAFNNNGLGFNGWEAPDGFRPTTCPATVTADRPGGLDECMDFDPGPGVDNTLDVDVAAGKPFRLSLGWAEAMFGVGTDLDLYVFNGAPASLTAKEDNVTTGDPTEFGSFTTGGAGSRQIVIRRYAGTGAPRLRLVSFDNGENTITGMQAVTAPDVRGPAIVGHNGAASAQTVGAVPFDNASTIETFSSRGPATYLFEPVDGVTPAAALPAPLTVAKPDVAATDGTANTFFGALAGPTFRFFGTSAAAPHAAAVGALQLEANPTLGQAAVKSAQATTAIPVGAFGPDAAGAGLVQAPAAIAANPTPPPTVAITSGPTGSIADATPSFEFVTTGDLKTLACTAAGVTQACTSPFTPAGLADGAQAMTVTATDRYDQAASATRTFELDTTGPRVRFVKAPKKKTKKRKLKVTFTSTESGSTFTCKLDKGREKPCRSPFSAKVKPGRHSLTVQATDSLGNRGAASTVKWTVKPAS